MRLRRRAGAHVLTQYGKGKGEKGERRAATAQPGETATSVRLPQQGSISARCVLPIFPLLVTRKPSGGLPPCSPTTSSACVAYAGRGEEKKGKYQEKKRKKGNCGDARIEGRPAPQPS